jgi:hypothetical protein
MIMKRNEQQRHTKSTISITKLQRQWLITIVLLLITVLLIAGFVCFTLWVVQTLDEGDGGPASRPAQWR